MTRAARIATGLAITGLLLILVSVYTWQHVTEWNRLGWAGIFFLPAPPPGDRAAANTLLGLTPGRVVFAYQGAPGATAGVRAGDVIRAIDGVPITNLAGLRQLSDRARAGDRLHYEVMRGGVTKRLDVPLASPFSSLDGMLAIATSLPVADLFLAIGLIVFCRKPEDTRAVVFSAMAVAGALSMIATVSQGIDAGQGRGFGLPAAAGNSPFAAFLLLLGFVSLPLILHLSLIFPKQRPVLVRHPQLVRWIYGFPLVTAVLIGVVAVCAERMTPGKLGPPISRLVHGIPWLLLVVVPLLVLTARPVLRRIREQKFSDALFSNPGRSFTTLLLLDCASFLMLFGIARLTHQRAIGGIAGGLGVLMPFLPLALYPIATCIAFFRSYRESNAEEKRQVRWPLWATIVSVGVKVCVVLIGFVVGAAAVLRPGVLPATSALLSILGVMPRIASILIPLSFAFAILKYRLMDIDIIIRKTVVYTLLSGLIVVVYLGVVAGLGSVLMNLAGVESRTMVVASTLAMALVFVPVRNKLQQLVDRSLFRQRQDYPLALRTIAAAVVSNEELTGFLHAAAEQMQHALQNRSVIVFLRRHAELVATAKIGVADTILGSLRFNEAGSLAAQLADRPFDPRKRALDEVEQARLKRLGVTLIVPIRSHAMQGFLALGGKLSDRDYDIEDGDFVSSAADQIAIAIDRFRLRREEAEFDQAREMQQALLPREIFQLDGFRIAGVWQPARSVGGDYFDLIRRGEDEMVVCIGDVAGKGMPAALLMSSLQAAVRACVPDSQSPREICSRVRRVVVSNLTGGRFVTFFLGILNRRTQEFVYSNAGHNPPIVVRADGTVERCSEGGPVIGRLFHDTPYVDGRVALAPGDRIVLFTDGVTEARNAEDEFGDERLIDLIRRHRSESADELQSTILDALRDFSAAEAEDDVTMVVVAVG